MKWLALAVATFGACLLSPPPYDKSANISGCMALAEAQCKLHDRCTDGFQSIHIFGDEPTCEMRSALICIYASQMRDTGQTVDQLATCASQTAVAPCSVFFEDNPPPDCDATGFGALGEPCGVDGECRFGFCDVASDTVCGTCKAKPQIGSPCMFVGDCGHDLACARAIGAPTGTCAAWIELDGACPDDQHPCSPSLSCFHGNCVAAGTVGAVCDGTGALAPACDQSVGLSCISSTCVTNARVVAGDPCGSFSGQFASCINGAECVKASGDKTGVCVAPAADGAACSNDPSIGPPCFAPAKCVAGICTVPDARTCRTQ